MSAPTLTPTYRVGDSTHTVPLYYVTRPEEILPYLVWVADKRQIAVDIETDGMTPDGLDWRSKKIATLQIGTPVGPDPRSYVFCVRSLGVEALRPVMAIFDDPEVLKIGQNIRFEILFTTEAWGCQWRNVYDCQVAELVLRAGLITSDDSARGKRKDDGEETINRAAYRETSMDALMRRYFATKIDKDDTVRRSFWATPPGALNTRQLIYSAGDVIYPVYLFREQRDEIKDRGLSSVMRIENALIPILADSERWGIWIDQDQWRALADVAETDRATARAALDALLKPFSDQTDMFGETGPRPTLVMKKKVVEANYNAADHVKRLFLRYCKAKRWKVEVVTSLARWNALKRAYGATWLEKMNERAEVKKTVADIPDWVVPEDVALPLFSVKADHLKLAKLRGQLPSELLTPYFQYRDAAKRVGTYGYKFLKNVHPATGRIHVYWHQALTTTGRLSSEPNLQNIPREQRYRQCFRPQPGWKFIIRDYSQIEPRLSAEVSNDPLYMATFNDNADIYVRVGESMTGQTIDKETKPGKVARQGSKAVVLATAYNMGFRKLRDRLTLQLGKYIESGDVQPPTVDYAREQLNTFFEIAPEIKKYQNECIAGADPKSPTARKTWDRYAKALVTWVTAPCGRKRFFPPDAKNVYTEGPNAPIQGCSATITKLAAVLMWERARDLGIEVHVVNYVHDELIVEVPEAHAEAMSVLLKDCMEDAGRRYISAVPVIAAADGADKLGIWDYWHKEE